MESYVLLITERIDGVGLIRLNRPERRNALSTALMRELRKALDAFESDDAVGAIILTGDERAFAAGADIEEMRRRTFVDALLSGFITTDWERIASCRKPVIAAVSGYALGGGCELAMACDIILAADTAKFGQPEIGIGTIPGMGGTQRLTRAVGKAKAMEMCLTGRMIDADEAERIGLVSRVVPVADLLEEALRVGARIAALSRPAIMLAKEAVNRAFETTLAEGVLFERRLFYATFGTEDAAEGMAAFCERRKPVFKNR